MASQTTIAVSPDHKYVAAQVHQHISIVEWSTGRSIDLPAPVLPLPRASEEDDAEADDDDEEDAAGDNNEGGESSAKRAKTSASAASASASSSGGGAHAHHPKPIRVLAFHPKGEWFVYESEDKYVHLYHMHEAYEKGFKHIVSVLIPRKVQSLEFYSATSPSTQHFHPTDASKPLHLPQLMVADKTGDIFRVHGVDLVTQTNELAHLANLTQLTLYQSPDEAARKKKGGKFFITSDSDAKIRVSHAPQFWDIQSYCLGHAAFVSGFVVLPLVDAPLILSGGFGSSLMLWRLHDGKLLSQIDLAEHRPKQEGEEDEAMKDGEEEKKKEGEEAAGSSIPTVDARAITAHITEQLKKSCYISQISMVPSEKEGEFKIAAAVYPSVTAGDKHITSVGWSYIFMLTYSTATSTLSVSHVLPTPSTPMTLLLTPPTPTVPAASSSSSSSEPAAPLPRLMYLDQSFELHAYRVGRECGRWKDATATGGAAPQQATQKSLAALSAPFEPARANLEDSLITEQNATQFIGQGSQGPKKAGAKAATEEGQEQEKTAAAAAASSVTGGDPNSRYISPFSSQASTHQSRLLLLSPGGFAYRRYFDKLKREQFILAKKIEAEARQAARVAEQKRKKQQQKQEQEQQQA